MNKLLGKVAIITGASRGIGRSIATEFAKEGALISLVYSKDDNGINETVNEIKKIGASYLILKKDISDFNNTLEIVTETISHFGKIDILVNNAGKSIVNIFSDSSKEDIDLIIGTNLLGAIYLTKHVVPHLYNKGGAILNISSMWGQVGASMEVLYSTTKGGINLFTKALSKELAPSNIRVNAIAPGVIDTTMNNCFSKEEKAELAEEIPLSRFGNTSEIAKAAVFLCSSDASYITGDILRVDGGFI